MLSIHQHIKTKLNSYIENNNIPNIIFYGHHGSGKKHLLQYLLNKMYQNIDDKSEYIMNVNCAFGKGIQFIREDLKFFSKTNLLMQNNGHFTIFKSIILLNADKLTNDAQSALRRCIEIFSNTTRFFIVTTDKTNILNPIQSRFHTIYVPQPFIQSIHKNENLHVFHKQQIKCNIHINHKAIIKKYIENFIDQKCLFKNEKERNQSDHLPDHLQNYNISDPIELSCYFYNKGITGLDILNYLHHSNILEENLDKYNLLIKLDTFRNKVRYENMFIFLILISLQKHFLSSIV